MTSLVGTASGAFPSRLAQAARRPRRLALVLLMLAGLACGPEPGEGLGDDHVDPSNWIQIRRDVEAATTLLLQAPGYRVSQVQFVDGMVAKSAWIDYRANGDFVSVERSTVLARGGHGQEVEYVAIAKVHGIPYLASSDTPDWSVVDPPRDSRPPLVLNLEELAAHGTAVLSPDWVDEASWYSLSSGRGSRELADGVADKWSLDAPFDGGSVFQEWAIDSGNHLVAYTVEFHDGATPQAYTQGVSSAAPVRTDRGFAPSKIDTQYTRLIEPAPIPVPTVGSTFNPAELSIPSGLPLFD